MCEFAHYKCYKHVYMYTSTCIYIQMLRHQRRMQHRADIRELGFMDGSLGGMRYRPPYTNVNMHILCGWLFSSCLFSFVFSLSFYFFYFSQNQISISKVKFWRIKIEETLFLLSHYLSFTAKNTAGKVLGNSNALSTKQMTMGVVEVLNTKHCIYVQVCFEHRFDLR